MVARVVSAALRLRLLVLAAALAVLGIGGAQLQDATVDAYPEFDDPAVQVQTEAPGLSALEVEQLITVPLEQDLLNGVPWLAEITSRSVPGLSAIDLVFEPGTDLQRARQVVQERMTQAAALPNVGTPPIMVAPTSSTSRVAMIGMRSSTVSMVDMSVLARWQIEPRLKSIPGVADVATWGQQDRQLQVQVDPQRLAASGVPLARLVETTGNALWVSPLSFVEASTPGTGGFVETPNQRIGVQHVSPITSSAQLADVTVPGAAGQPLRLGDVASVLEDHPPLVGGASVDGEQGLVLVVERFPGADSAQVAEDVDEALEAMAPGLSGIVLDPSIYRPTTYLEAALEGLERTAGLGLLLLAVALVALTRSWRLAVAALVAVALSLLAAVWVLHLRGQVLTTMTLLGLAVVLTAVVDDAVGDAAAVRARAAARRASGAAALAADLPGVVAARRGPSTHATLVVLLALLPVLVLTGPAGAFARPAVLTAALAVLASTAVALVVTPALVVLLAGRGRRAGVPLLPGWVQRGAEAVVARCAGRPALGAGAAAVLAVVALVGLAQAVPGPLLPALQERSALVRLQAAAGTSLTEMGRVTDAAAAELRGLPGVADAGTHVGRAVGSDVVADVDTSEIWLTLDPRADHDAVLEAVRATAAGYPGLRAGAGSYAGDRVAAATATTGDALVVRVYGQDLAVLRSAAERVAQVLATVGGVVSPVVQSEASRPGLHVQVDLAAAQRHGLQPGDVRREASTLVSGLTVGSLYEQQAVFDVVVLGGPPTRASVGAVQSLMIDTPAGQQVRLGDVAQVALGADPAVVTHDAVSRSLDVTALVQGRGAAEVAADTTERLQRLDLPFEYHAEVVGDAVDRDAARDRLLFAAVVVAVLALLLLQAATGTWRAAAVLFAVLPLAGAGALLVAPAVGGPGSLAVLAAVLAAVGLAARQALVLIGAAQRLRQAPGPTGSGGLPQAEAVRRAAGEAAGPVLATALATAALVLPAALSGGGAGLEVLHPFAVALLAGLVTAVVVVLVVVPALHPALADADADADDPVHAVHAPDGGGAR